jgi:hypothetical protein
MLNRAALSSPPIHAISKPSQLIPIPSTLSARESWHSSCNPRLTCSFLSYFCV